MRFLCKTAMIAVFATASLAGTGLSGETVQRHKIEHVASFVFHFGAGRGPAAVDAAMMDDFVEKVIIPRFPNGTSIYESVGRWKNPQTGEIQKEKSFILSIECYPQTANRAMIEEIAAEYVVNHKAANASCFIKVFPGVTTELFYNKY